MPLKDASGRACRQNDGPNVWLLAHFERPPVHMDRLGLPTLHRLGFRWLNAPAIQRKKSKVAVAKIRAAAANSARPGRTPKERRSAARENFRKNIGFHVQRRHDILTHGTALNQLPFSARASPSAPTHCGRAQRTFRKSLWTAHRAAHGPSSQTTGTANQPAGRIIHY